MSSEVVAALGLAGTIISSLIALWLATVRHAVFSQIKALEDRDERVEAASAKHDSAVAEIRKEHAQDVAKIKADAALGERAVDIEHAKLTERLHLDEVATVKLQGDHALMRQRQDGADAALAEIRAKMVTKEDVARIEKQLDRLLDQRRYPSYGQTPAVRPPESPVPPSGGRRDR